MNDEGDTGDVEGSEGCVSRQFMRTCSLDETGPKKEKLLI